MQEERLSRRSRLERSNTRFLGLVLAWCLAVSMFACGTSDGESAKPANDAGNDTGADAGCVPKTCEQIQANCGSAPDGCGGEVACGTCPDGQTCGGGGSNQCGTGQCTAKSCSELQAECGLASDGCSLVIDCGECTAPEVCGGGGVDNQCGCVAKSCAQLGASCGTVSTTCGDVFCGDCALPDTCGGGGTAYQCGAGYPACGNGAVTFSCTCGGAVISSGFCCGGLTSPTDCMRVRLDGGLATGTSTFDGKTFSPLLPYLTTGTAYDSIEGITENYPIAGTDYDALYQNETWVELQSPATFTIPVTNGNYTVHLHFVDWLYSTAGERQFHVDLQGSRVLTDLDIISEVGKSAALVKSFDVSVTTAVLTLTITDHVSYPEIAAIEILPQGESHLATTGAAVNHAPTVSAGADKTITLPTNSVTLTASAADADGDTLSYVWTKTAGGAATIVTPAAASTQINGLVAGSYTFKLTVDDGQGGSASDTVVVTVNPAVVVGPAYYVSPTGSDSNAGTSALLPFETLERARTAVRASTTTKTVYLLGGVYSRTATLYLGEEDAGQSWLGFPGETPILDGGSSTVTAITVWADNVTIRWLTLRNFVENTIFIDAFSPSVFVNGPVIDSNTILNALSNAWNQAGIVVGGTVMNAQITHNLIDGAQYIGIAGISGIGHDITGLTIAHNAVFNTCLSVADCGGIYAMDREHSSTDITIDNNIVGDYGSVTTGGRGIYLDDDLSNTTVRNNIVYGTGQWAFQFHGGDHNVLTNNIFDISGATKLGLYQDTGAPTFGMAGNSFSCNIVYSQAAPPSSLWDKYGTETVALPTVSANLYWGANGALPNTSPIIDTSPTVADPGFVDPGAADYSFATGNPAAFCGFQTIDVSQVGPLPNP